MPAFFKPIRPKKLRMDVFRLEFLNALRKAGTQVKKDFEKTTLTWRHKPKFEIVVSLAGGGVTLLVDTNDRVYNYLNRGTSVRRAIMSPDWQSKTNPMVLGSFPGRGKVVFISKNVAMPGIKARKFDKAIKKKRKRWFKKQIEEAMRVGARKSGLSQ